jgi:O-methyltransferase
MGIKQIIKKILESFFDTVGIEAKFCKKEKNRKAIVFDQNQLAQYFYPNKRMELYFEGLDNAQVRWTDNFSKQLRFYSLQQIIEHVLTLKLNGDFAECGCWKGHSSFIISKLLSKNNFQNKFHIFDSFEGGLSDKTSKDHNDKVELSAKEILKEKEIFSSREEDVGKVLEKFDFVKLYKGWIPDRFKEASDNKFSFVHIDVDLYEPTRDSLDFFFPRLIEGGGIVMDDYGMTQFPGGKKAMDEFLSRNEYTFFYEMPLGGCFIIK